MNAKNLILNFAEYFSDINVYADQNTSLPGRVWSIVIKHVCLLLVCLFVYPLAYLRNHMTKLD